MQPMGWTYLVWVKNAFSDYIVPAWNKSPSFFHTCSSYKSGVLAWKTFKLIFKQQNDIYATS